MSRIVFALAVPLVTIVLAGITATNVVGLAFAGEGCRTHEGPSLRWWVVSETVLMQVLFGVGFALALTVLSVVLRKRFDAIGRAYGNAFEWAATVGFVLMSLGQVIGLAACSLQPYQGLAGGLMIGAGVAFVAAAVLLVIAYGRGVSGSR